MKAKRIFIIVLDSYGIGSLPDAEAYGDKGSNTLGTIVKSEKYQTPNLEKLGLFNIEGTPAGRAVSKPLGAFGRMQEASKGKDTTTGHWEIAGLVSEQAMPVYPDGFPPEIIEEFEKRTGRKVLCNKPYSGTEVIKDYGKQHVEEGSLIVYTSADSVFQIAAHEDVVPVAELYKYCEIAREMLQGEHAVGRVIARPFDGTWPDFARTSNRHDFSLIPPRDTMLDILSKNGWDTIGVGKIGDIFAGKGVSASNPTVSNDDGMEKTLALMDQDFTGLCFVNLVDFDMKYGHRNDIDGYAAAATAFDRQLEQFIRKMKDDDMLMITADHGCDPGYPGTDHTREYVPVLVYGRMVNPGINLGTRAAFADLGATVVDNFGLKEKLDGTSFLNEVLSHD